MAGDWIKIQHTTPDKPEVAAMAATLGIDQDLVVGKLVRLWIWADQQTIDGNALSVTPAFLDRITYCPGFSAAACSVGWLVDRNGRLQLPNFDRHNGQTAKSRALTSDRVKRSRNAPTVTESLPEKRREESSKKENARAGPKRLEPMNFDPWLQAFMAMWEATPGVATCGGDVSEVQRRLIEERLDDPWFRKNWRPALEKFPLKFFRAKRSPVGISKFFEAGFAEKVLEGKYDVEWESGNGRTGQSGGASKPASRSYDSTGSIEALAARITDADAG